MIMMGMQMDLMIMVMNDNDIYNDYYNDYYNDNDNDNDNDNHSY